MLISWTVTIFIVVLSFIGSRDGCSRRAGRPCCWLDWFDFYLSVRVELCISSLVGSPMQTRVDSLFSFIEDRVVLVSLDLLPIVSSAIMSLPLPSTTHQSHPITNADDFAEFEQPLMELARRSKGDLRRLLTAFFGFLHRRTDFYCVTDGGGAGEAALTSMGFRMGEAEKLLLASFRQFPLRKVGTAAPPPPPRPGAPARSPPAQRGVLDSKDHATEKSSATNKPSSVSSSNDSNEQESAPIDEKASSATTSTTPTTSSTTKHDTTKMAVDDAETTTTTATTTTTTSAAATTANIRWTEEGLQIPVGNGGTTDRYQWTQTLEEVTVLVPVDGALRGKDLHVTIAPQSLSIRTKKVPLLSSSLPSGETKPTEPPPTYEYAIDPNESTWSLEGGVVQVILYKTIPTFWSHVIQGDAEIDTDLVDNRRDIHSYDKATQAKLRQIMFDQAQMAKGLPTSDQLQKGKIIPPLPPGVEYINQEVLDKASSATAEDGGKPTT
jgi:hypothetical protein